MHVISPFESSTVLCNTSEGFFKSLRRPSKDPVSAGLISGRKTKYFHLLEENVFATLLKFHTVVCSWLSPGSWSWYWSERFYWTLILWGSRVCQTSLQGVLRRKCGRKEKKINSAAVGEKEFSAFFFLAHHVLRFQGSSAETSHVTSIKDAIPHPFYRR